MKNSFFVFIEVIFAILFLFLCGMGAFIWFTVDAFGEDISVTVTITIMCVVLPSVLLLWGICTFAARLIIDNNGIKKSLFGIKVKYYKWEEIDHIKKYGSDNYVSSISFYKVRREKQLFKWMKYERIFFTCSPKKLEILNRYAPAFIKEQLNINV